MDNITHSVVGLGVGELVQRSLPPEPAEADQRTRHRLLLTACALASNFPDLDLLLTGLLPAPLGYLLHHRGHTHTLLYALPQALLLLAMLWLLWPGARHLLRRSRTARVGLALAVGLGFCLHLLMDFLNSYGVHPFYPFDPRWFYGDMVFIVEPLFWVAFGVPLIMAIARLPLRALLLAALAAVLLYFTWKGFLAWHSLAVLLLVGAGLGAVRAARRRGRRSLALALAVCAGFVAVQGAASVTGRAQVETALQRMDPQARVLDVAMTAFPAQPLCWIFISVESKEAAGTYRLRRGLLSLAPDWLPAARCPASLIDPSPPLRESAQLALYAEQEASLPALRRLRQENCQLDAWLRFARVPGLRGDVVSDLRFSSTPRGNFTTMDLNRAAQLACPRDVPRWAYPRADLLAPPAIQP